VTAAIARAIDLYDLNALLRYAATLLLSLIVVGIVLSTNGTVITDPLTIVWITAVIILITPPAFGYSLFVGIVLLNEQFHICGLESLVTLTVPYFLNLNLTTGISALVINPVELYLAIMGIIWALKTVTLRTYEIRPVPHVWATFLFLATLVFFLGYGMARHGDLKVALWELRALFYLCLSFLLGTQLIRTRPQMILLVWSILIAIAIKGYQGMYRYWIDLEGNLDGIPAITGHEDALFMATVFIFTIALIFFRGPRGMIWFGMITFPTTFLTFVLTQRRIAYGVFVFGLIILFVYLPKKMKVLFVKMALPMLPLVLIYFALFWNSNSSVAMPVKQVKSVFCEEEKEQDRSNLYREYENFNLQQTIRYYPQGIGFGKKYLIFIPLDEIDFPLWEYIPHNCILWLWVKMGFLGFWVFWIFCGVLVVQITWDFRHTKDPLYRSIQLLAVIFIISQLMVSKYDLQITFYRNMIYLGSVLALAVTARILGGAADEERRLKGFAPCP